MRTDARVAVARGVAALALATLVVAGSVLPLVHVPAYTRLLARAVGAPELSGLPEPVALRAAEDVRRVVAGGPESALPAHVGGREGFGAAERSHLADVRGAVGIARRAAAASALVLAAALALTRRGSRRAVARGAARTAAALLGGLALLGVAAGALDFGALFERFHGVFFEGDTWVFPYASLLVQLFPAPFWAVSAAVWAGLCLAAALALFVAGRRQGSEEV